MDQELRYLRPEFDRKQIDDTLERLKRTRYPDSETVDDWSQGMPLAYTQELVRHWTEDYDWSRVPDLLNQYENLVTCLDGIEIHLLHIRSCHTTATPMIITHGWPGSIIEFFELIPRLVDPTSWNGTPDQAFHLVIPSLPGYGFSGKPTIAGVGVERIAAMWDKLMQRLGYLDYLAQGGDWGSVVTHRLLTQPHTKCIAGHANLPLIIPDDISLQSDEEKELDCVSAALTYQKEESGYSKQQSTKPQTLAYGLADSPVGQLAWITEKYAQWTDCERDGITNPENAICRDQILDIVTHFWMTNSGGSSARLYWESFDSPDTTQVSRPIGISLFPKEIFRCTKRLAKTRYQDLVFFNSEHQKGGHFASMEQPDALTKDLRAWLTELRNRDIV